MVGKGDEIVRQKRSIDGVSLTWRLVIGYHLVESIDTF